MGILAHPLLQCSEGLGERQRGRERYRIGHPRRLAVDASAALR
jgi:hypothetical protein